MLRPIPSPGGSNVTPMAAAEVPPVVVAPPHVSGAQRFLARAMYVFFARPILFLLPALVITAFGMYQATSEPDEYRSIGSLSVSESTVLANQTPAARGVTGAESPAATTALQFNELMQTDGFVNQVIDGASLKAALNLGFISLDGVRKHVYAVAAGDQLMRIIASAEQPDTARALAQSAITTYKTRVITDEVGGSGVAETFWNDQLDDYKNQLDAANAALQTFLTDHPDPVRGERPSAELQQIETLRDDVTRTQTRFDAALNNREQARLASVISSADIDQRLRVLDEPTVPSVPESGLRDLLLTVVIFGALGVMMSLVAVAVATLLERSILSAADLERLGAPVRAVVPRAKRMNLDGRRLAVVKSEPQSPTMLSAG
jgi:uncharacterized protein involved in exopolysaccharide biosynthesis